MSLLRTGMNISFGLLSKFAQVSYPANELKQKNKIHDYSQFVLGSDFVFEPLHEEMKGYMTGMGKGIKPSDYIILQLDGILCKYQVEKIDYYSDPSDMWIALLKQVAVK
ncbi:hypothetical protein WKK05_17120 [Nostoc sp. UHCC 0302]|uniref:hypothetical protein n=1 Tax=Nostoc sp. UHCC 0302 TaxID=3134896 RepID=UPI00311CB6BA